MTKAPPVMHAQKAYGSESAYLLNCPIESHNNQNPGEFRAAPFNNDIPHISCEWSLKHEWI